MKRWVATKRDQKALLQVKSSSGELVAAQVLVDVPFALLEEVEAHWKVFKDRALELHTQQGRAIPAGNDWNWTRKWQQRDPENHLIFGLSYTNRIQGLLMLSVIPLPSRLPSRLDEAILYIGYLQNAPWNLREYVGESSGFRGVGTALIQIAIESSFDAGCKGRLGLHSLPAAEGFYRRHFKDLGPDQLKYDLRYFENSDAQIAEYLSGKW